MVTLLTYYKKQELFSGDFIGKEMFEQIETVKRYISPYNKFSPFTIITEEDCFLLSFDKFCWDTIIKEVYDKQKRFNHCIICSSEIFHHYLNHKFIYYNLFKLKQIDIHSNLITEREQPEYVYFIKQGEFKVSVNRSILELSEIISLLGGGSWSRDKKHYERVLSNNGINI